MAEYSDEDVKTEAKGREYLNDYSLEWHMGRVWAKVNLDVEVSKAALHIHHQRAMQKLATAANWLTGGLVVLTAGLVFCAAVQAILMFWMMCQPK